MFNLAMYTNFQLFLEAIYPVGVTEVPLSFVCKITYNSLNADQIYPKSDTGIHI